MSSSNVKQKKRIALSRYIVWSYGKGGAPFVASPYAASTYEKTPPPPLGDGGATTIWVSFRCGELARKSSCFASP